MLLIFHGITLPSITNQCTKQHIQSAGIFIETILVFNKYLKYKLNIWSEQMGCTNCDSVVSFILNYVY